jgi:putative protein-disulfide isomerase
MKTTFLQHLKDRTYLPYAGCLVLLIFLLSLSGLKSKPMEKPELIYVYDPLCGWCYGFSPVMMKVKEKFGDSLKITVISGGMVVGEREGPIGNMAPFIKQAYKQVEQYSGVKFGEPFLKGTLEEGKMNFSSVPPSLALSVFKSMNEGKSLEFAQAIQKMIYYDGKDLNQVASYVELLKPFGLDEKEFQNRFKDSTYLKSMRSDFNYSDELEVTGFPAVFIKHKGKVYPITRGYDSFERVEKKILRYLD